MRLAELLTIERVDIDLQAESKREALIWLSRLLASGLVRAPTPSESSLQGATSNDASPDGLAGPGNAEDVQRILEAREALASTGVGDGVAIPHGRVPGLDRFIGALAIRRTGVAFDAIDGRPASIFFALIGPEKAAGEHLKCLARISRVLRDEAVRNRLMQAADAEQALRIVLDTDS